MSAGPTAPQNPILGSYDRPFARRVPAAALLVLCLAMLSLFGNATAQQAPITIVGVHSHPPLADLKDGAAAGAVYELARALAEGLDRRPVFKLMDQEAAQNEVLTGKADILALLTVSEARRTLFDFSTPVLNVDYAFLSRGEGKTLDGPKDAEGLRIGVIRGERPQQALGTNPKIDLVFVPNYRRGTAMLRTGQIDGLAADVRVAAELANAPGLTPLNSSSRPFSSAVAAFAVQKGNEALLQEIDRVLETLRQDGSIDRVVQGLALPLSKAKGDDDPWQRVDIPLVGLSVLCGLFLLGMVLLWRRADRQTAELRRAQGDIEGRVTERTQELAEAAKALRRSEQDYRRVFEEGVLGFARVTPGGRLLLANDAMARIHGYDKAEELLAAVGNVTNEIWLSRDQGEAFLTELAANEVIEYRELEVFRHRDRQRIWLAESVRLVRDDEGSFVFYETTARDITARVLAEDKAQALDRQTKELERQEREVERREREVERQARVAALEELEAVKTYRQMVENAALGIFRATPEGALLESNDAFARLHGYDNAAAFLAAVGGAADDVWLSRDPQASLREELQGRDLLQGHGFELRQHRTGDKTWVSLNLRVLRDEASEIVCYDGIVEDASERHLAEMTAADSLARYQDLARSGSDWIWELDENYRYCHFSAGREAKTGRTPRQDLGLTPWEAFGPGEPWPALRDLLMVHQAFRDFRYHLVDVAGVTQFFKASGVPVFDRDGRFQGYRGTALRETEEVLALGRARGAEAQLREAMEGLPDGVAQFDSEGRLVMINDRALKLFGMAKDDVPLGSAYREVVRKLAFSGTLRGAQGRPEEWLANHLGRQDRLRGGAVEALVDGRWVLLRVAPTEEGGTLLTATEITELKRAELAARDRDGRAVEALRVSEQRYQDFAAAASDWFWECDETLRFSYFSESYFSNDPSAKDWLIGKTRRELLAAGDPVIDETTTIEHWMAHIDDLEAHLPFRDFEYPLHLASGQVRYFSISGKPLVDEEGEFQGYRGTLADITLRRARERQQDAADGSGQRDRRLEAQSDLAGNLAAEVGKRLQPILTLAKLAQVGVEEPRLRGYQQKILEQSEETAEILRDLACFGQGENFEVEEVDAQDLLQQALRLARDHTPPRIAFQFEISDASGKVFVNSGGFARVILNLVANSVDAMAGTGTIRVRADMVSIDPGAEQLSDLTAGGYLHLSIADSGDGIPEDRRVRIFEPFYTTKPDGQGLGLAVVYGLVRSWGGHVAVESSPGERAQFHIYVPARTSAATTS